MNWANGLWLLVLAGCVPDPLLDGDGDGVGFADDCDDSDPTVGAATSWFLDADGDGHGGAEVQACAQPAAHLELGGDCDDTDAAVWPGAQELCNGQDDDCDGEVDEGLSQVERYVDRDGDGFGDTAEVEVGCDGGAGLSEVGGDCDDRHPGVHPGAPETWYDGLDNDCDAATDDADRDADGVRAAELGGADCDDSDAGVHPGAEDVWYDGVDADCSGNDDLDADLDGFAASEAGGADCDDTDPEVHPDATEACNGLDEDCSGAADEGVCALAWTGSPGDLVRVDLLTGMESAITATPDIDESAGRVGPLGTRVATVYYDEAGVQGLHVLDAWTGEDTPVVDNASDGYTMAYGYAWTGVDSIAVNRRAAYYDYRIEWFMTDGSDLGVILDHSALGEWSACCSAEFILRDAFTDSVAGAPLPRLVLHGLPSVNQPQMDVFDVDLEAETVDPILDDDNYDDHSPGRLSRDGSRYAWRHASVSGWPPGGYQIVAADLTATGTPVVLLETGSDSWSVVGWSADDAWVYATRTGELVAIAADGSGTVVEVHVLAEGGFLDLF